MMVVTRIVLADTSTPTPLIAGCMPSQAAPFTSLSSFPGCTASLCLLVQCWYMSVHLSAQPPGAVSMIWVVRGWVQGVDRVGVLPDQGQAFEGQHKAGG